jgi:carbon monoxide dehydrogenase subunit G
MPGATLTGVDGDTFTGTVKVKLGPVALTYKGTGVYVEKDESAKRAVIEANAKDARGNGTVSATITIVLTGEGDHTDGTVTTDMTITGKPAQFGRGMISDVGGKILEQFAACLSKKLGPAAAEPEEAPAAGASAATPAAAASAAPASAPKATASAPKVPAAQPEAEPLDLMQYARGSAVQRIAPVVGVVAILAVILAVILRKRSN